MATRIGSESGIALAIFCDYENVAIGARDAGYESFDIQLVIERLLDKGPIVVKKAYCDWDSYKSAKKPLHEAAFELIEIPHVSYSGKNSADIRLVVDALDLCYTKPQVEGFVIISGDSDFSPLVSKLRENSKKVVGVGVKSSTSHLLVDNCDDFVYYDDLVRDRRRKAQRGTQRKTSAGRPKDTANVEERRLEALELVVDTVEALFRDREDNVWSSLVKQTLKRKRPNFAESYHGYRSFNELLEDAQSRDLLVLEKDERSGGYLVKELGASA